MTPREAALLIEALGAQVEIRWSSYTGQFYASVRGVDLSNGSTISSVCPHNPDAGSALVDLVRQLQEEGQGESVVAVTVDGQRRNYRWNGVAFAVIPDYALPWKVAA